MRYEWDDLKNLENQAKHGISFEEALPLFETDYEIEFDHEHSSMDEDRYIAFGTIKIHGEVMAVFIEFLDDDPELDSRRIISVRKVKP